MRKLLQLSVLAALLGAPSAAWCQDANELLLAGGPEGLWAVRLREGNFDVAYQPQGKPWERIARDVRGWPASAVSTPRTLHVLLKPRGSLLFDTYETTEGPRIGHGWKDPRWKLGVAPLATCRASGAIVNNRSGVLAIVPVRADANAPTDSNARTDSNAPVDPNADAPGDPNDPNTAPSPRGGKLFKPESDPNAKPDGLESLRNVVDDAQPGQVKELAIFRNDGTGCSYLASRQGLDRPRSPQVHAAFHANELYLLTGERSGWRLLRLSFDLPAGAGDDNDRSPSNVDVSVHVEPVAGPRRFDGLSPIGLVGLQHHVVAPCLRNPPRPADANSLPGGSGDPNATSDANVPTDPNARAGAGDRGDPNEAGDGSGMSGGSQEGQAAVIFIAYEPARKSLLQRRLRNDNEQPATVPTDTSVRTAVLGDWVVLSWREEGENRLLACAANGEILEAQTVDIFEKPIQEDRSEQVVQYVMIGVMIALFVPLILVRPKGPMKPFALPENVKPGNLLKRLLAGFIDLVIFGPIAMAVFPVDPGLVDFPPSMNPENYPLNMTLASLLMLGLHVIYGLLMEWKFQTTLGKKLMGLKVVGTMAGKPGPRECFLRNLMKIVEIMTFLMPLLVLLPIITPYRQRLGDMLARTAVVDVSTLRANGDDQRQQEERPPDEPPGDP